jgi:hypothetical protein
MFPIPRLGHKPGAHTVLWHCRDSSIHEVILLPNKLQVDLRLLRAVPRDSKN